MINRPASLWIGGDSVKLEKVSQALVDLGVYVEVFEKPLISPAVYTNSFDIIHTWNFSMNWSKYAIWMGAAWKKKVVATMIYHEGDSHVSYPDQQLMLTSLDAAIYETQGEIERVARHLVVPNWNQFIVPNGVDEAWFTEDDRTVPFKDYVLTVGRIEPNKGQLEAAKASKALKRRYIMIGERVVNDYAIQCENEGALWFPPMSQDQLKPWYKHCAVYVQPSFAETWGMAVDEAGTQNVPIVFSTGFERQDIPEGVQCVYGNVESITRAIEQAISQERTGSFQALLKERTWKQVAEEYKKIYEKII